jgi:hypothetical protein
MDYYKDKSVVFSAYHGDFTPWNMFFERGQLFVFDFEYAQMTYPPYLDWFHFFTQCCIFEKHLTTNEIYNAYQIRKQEVSGYLINPDFYYLCYLLGILSLYLDRDKENPGKDVKHNLEIWISLISCLVTSLSA